MACTVRLQHHFPRAQLEHKLRGAKLIWCRRRLPSIIQRRRVVLARAQQEEEVLQQILSLPDPELRAWYADNTEIVTLEFMLWLSGRETAASGREKASLDALGSKLTALREGLDPETAAQLLSSFGPMELAPAMDDSTMETQIQLRSAQLGLRLAQTATSPAELVAERNRALQFAKDLRLRKTNSTTEVMGRAPVESQQALRGLDAATAAERILDVLLQIPNERERSAMVAEAFIPPEDVAAEDSGDEELVHTTPMRLLQAVKLAQRRLQADPDASKSQPLLPGTPGMSVEELQDALQSIQAAIFASWDSPSF